MTSILSRFKERRREPEKPPAATRIFNLNDRKLTDDYTVRDVLGKGSFSTVRRAVHRVTGDVVAVKIIDKNSIDVKVEALKMEVRILLSIKHPNIVNLIDVYEDDSFVYLAMELMTGGELFDRICNDYPTGYSEREAAVLIRKIFEAVKYLHENGVIHRDLKPENLLFSTPEKTGTEIKISDFGLAKIRSGDALVRTACGSPNYVAPEVLTHDMKGYSFACDMWSLGVILYVLLCGFCPFYDESTPALFQAIIAGEYSFPSPYWDGISEAAKDLVRKLLLVDPDARLTPAAALAHPWLAGPAPSAVIPHIGDQMRKFQSDRSRAAMAAPP